MGISPEFSQLDPTNIHREVPFLLGLVEGCSPLQVSLSSLLEFCLFPFLPLSSSEPLHPSFVMYTHFFFPGCNLSCPLWLKGHSSWGAVPPSQEWDLQLALISFSTACPDYLWDVSTWRSGPYLLLFSISQSPACQRCSKLRTAEMKENPLDHFISRPHPPCNHMLLPRPSISYLMRHIR